MEGIMSKDRQQKRREMRHLKNESVWLQKALFALRKAEDAREQLSDIRNEKHESYVISVGDRDLVFEELEDALDTRIESLIKTVRELRRELY
jgi:hypothetical protein